MKRKNLNTMHSVNEDLQDDLDDEMEDLIFEISEDLGDER